MEADQLHGRREAFRLAVHPEMVESQETSEENPRFLVPRDYDGIRRGTYVAAHSLGPDGPGLPQSELCVIDDLMLFLHTPRVPHRRNMQNQRRWGPVQPGGGWPFPQFATPADCKRPSRAPW